ncbi:hypothetical protein GKZ27_10055 [Enterorhabdus mucosicola]|uniref:Uncharacterized protein n=1 Tax=Adlercreutzia mucosicola TaxID=580026 RepID=A0A6N8JRK0_9ACTN|nr:hypothetical protein [Adlercreutzia mucosicola]MVX61787.1 hypothetical protein [Adlercreutzia mucosicola]
MKAAADAIDIVPDALVLVEDVSAVIARRVGRIEISIAENGTGLRKVHGAPPKSLAPFLRATFHRGKHRQRPGEVALDCEKQAPPVYFSQSSAVFSARPPETGTTP